MKLLRRSGYRRVKSLQGRLFIFFTLLAFFLAGALFLILSITGVFDRSSNRYTVWMNAEIMNLKTRVSDDFSRLSLRGVSFAGTLASGIRNWTHDKGITERDIASHPELIESLLAEYAGLLISILENNICSGVFLILDATVSQNAPDSDFSRAGIFFKRTEPNNISSVASKIHCLRGPASVARANNIELMGQWRMEFETGNMYFFPDVMEKARENYSMDLSRLYYWSRRFLMPGNSEHGMMLCLPLIARDGYVYGICGIEVSSLLYKRLYSPDNSVYPRVFSSFAPLSGGNFNTDSGLVAGNSFLTSQTTGILTDEYKGTVSLWNSDSGETYAGLLEEIRLYPSDSPFSKDTWALALLVPQSDWNDTVRQANIFFYGACFALLAVCFLAAFFISRRYIRPVVSAFENIKTGAGTDLRKTKIDEIDEFLEHIAKLIEEREKLGEENSLLAARKEAKPQKQDRKSGAALAAQNTDVLFEKLSYQELRISQLILQGYTYTEIADVLKLKPNTVKWYLKALYSKLGINSKRELFEIASRKK